MATFTMSLSGSAVINGSKSFTISDADVQNWVNYLVFVNTPVGGAPPTPAQALLAMAQNFANEQRGQVLSWMTQQQINQINVTPITFT